MRLLDMEVANVESLLTQLVALRDNWKAMWNEAELVASSLQSEVNCLGSVVPLRYKERDSMMRMHPGAELGGAKGGHFPQKFCLVPPVAPQKFFRSFSESPTQTIDSPPCCKSGPSSGPPNENVWLRPWMHLKKT